jgi:protease I
MTRKKAAILVHNYFEQSEFEKPLIALQHAGVEVDVISATKKELQALEHVNKGDRFDADMLLSEANPDDYDILILPGGAINADALRMVQKARYWVTYFLENDRIVAAICHAPWLLVSADVVEGRSLTSYYTLQDDITNAGGEWEDLPLIVDDNLITSRNPGDLNRFNDAILASLKVQRPKQPMLHRYHMHRAM